MPNVFISRKIGSQWRTILGHPQLIECMGIFILSPAHEFEERSSDVICVCEKLIWIFFLPGYVSLDGLFFKKNFRDFFSDFFEGGLLGKSFIGNI